MRYPASGRSRLLTPAHTASHHSHDAYHTTSGLKHHAPTLCNRPTAAGHTDASISGQIASEPSGDQITYAESPRSR